MSKLRTLGRGLRALGRGFGTFLVVIGVGVVVITIFIAIVGNSIGGGLTWNDAANLVQILIIGFVAIGIGAGIRAVL